jgi:DNA-binding winged helix-turn-helix (wHTH) protein
MLVERAGDVVTRAELQQHVWSGDTFVDFERGLNYCIAQIRTALGDSASSSRFIETLPRRGYRFIAPVNAPVSAPISAPISAAVAGEQASRSVAGGTAADDANAGPPSSGGDAAAPAPAPSAVSGLVSTLGIWSLVIAGVIGAWTFVGQRQAADRAARAGASAAKSAAPAALAAAPAAAPAAPSP